MADKTATLKLNFAARKIYWVEYIFFCFVPLHPPCYLAYRTATSPKCPMEPQSHRDPNHTHPIPSQPIPSWDVQDIMTEWVGRLLWCSFTFASMGRGIKHIWCVLWDIISCLLAITLSYCSLRPTVFVKKSSPEHTKKTRHSHGTQPGRCVYYVFKLAPHR